MSNIFYGQSKSPLIDQWMNQLVGPFITVFTIHRAASTNGSFSGTDEKLLAQCLNYAKEKNYKFASIDQLAEDAFNHKIYNEPTLCFTMDDGYEDQVTRLTPILLDYEAFPTLFVITDFIDQKLWPWDAKLAFLLWNTVATSCTIKIGANELTLDLSSPDKRIAARRLVIQTIKLLPHSELDACIQHIAQKCQLAIPSSAPKEYTPTTWETLRHLETQGLRIGSHTKSHIVFNSTHPSQISDELIQSKQKLTSELANPSSIFCYPLGTNKDFSAEHIQLVRAAGYSAAISTISDTTSLRAIRKHPYQIRRIGFPNSLEKFIRYTSWLEVLRSKVPF